MFGLNIVEWLASTALGRKIKANLWTIVMIVVLLACAFGLYKYIAHLSHDRDQALQTVATQQVKLQQKDTIIAQLNQQIKAAAQSARVTANTEQQAQQVQTQIETRYVQVIKTVHDKVTVVQTDPKLTPTDKSKAVSQIYVNTLWTNYCQAGHAAEDQCKAYLPPPVPLVIPSNAPVVSWAVPHHKRHAHYTAHVHLPHFYSQQVIYVDQA